MFFKDEGKQCQWQPELSSNISAKTIHPPKLCIDTVNLHLKVHFTRSVNVHYVRFAPFLGLGNCS